MTVSLASVQDFVKFANERGFKPEFITRAGGHTWQFWQECLPKALVKVGESFK
jgi:S-formylglutathione hydrolase FrmB